VAGPLNFFYVAFLSGHNFFLIFFGELKKTIIKARTESIGHRTPPDRLIDNFGFQTAAPPVASYAHLCFLEYEAGNVGNVEEHVAHAVAGGALRHLQTRPESIITGAVHNSMKPHVGESELGLSRLDADCAAQVVLSTAPVCRAVSAQFGVAICPPTLPTPSSSRHSY